MIFSYAWPIALIVISNLFYHICTKSAPQKMDPFASLTITYLIGALIAAGMFFIMNPGQNIFKEYTKTNWAVAALGIAIVGLEVGNIMAYKAGWEISMENIVQSSILTVFLVLVGVFIYKEHISARNFVGIICCMAGLVLLNL